MKNYRKFRPAKAGLFVLVGLAAVAAGSMIVMLLWNALLPSLLKLPLIGFWQALGILILARILFGRHGRPAWAGSACYGWKMRHFRKHWEHLSPEEREKLRTEWRGRCGSFAGEKAAG